MTQYEGEAKIMIVEVCKHLAGLHDQNKHAGVRAIEPISGWDGALIGKEIYRGKSLMGNNPDTTVYEITGVDSTKDIEAALDKGTNPLTDEISSKFVYDLANNKLYGTTTGIHTDVRMAARIKPGNDVDMTFTKGKLQFYSSVAGEVDISQDRITRRAYIRRAIATISRVRSKLVNLGFPGNVLYEVVSVDYYDKEEEDSGFLGKSIVVKHLPGKHNQNRHAGQQTDIMDLTDQDFRDWNAQAASLLEISEDQMKHVRFGVLDQYLIDSSFYAKFGREGCADVSRSLNLLDLASNTGVSIRDENGKLEGYASFSYEDGNLHMEGMAIAPKNLRYNENNATRNKSISTKLARKAAEFALAQGKDIHAASATAKLDKLYRIIGLETDETNTSVYRAGLVWRQDKMKQFLREYGNK